MTWTMVLSGDISSIFNFLNSKHAYTNLGMNIKKMLLVRLHCNNTRKDKAAILLQEKIPHSLANHKIAITPAWNHEVRNYSDLRGSREHADITTRVHLRTYFGFNFPLSLRCSVENDGTYSATVWWKRRSGYRIDYWGQGNDLATLPMGAARAYYKTGIHESG